MAASSFAASACCSRSVAAEPLHLLLERLAVVFLRLRADVAPGREHVAVLADVVERGGFAEAGDVAYSVSPSPVRANDLSPRQAW